MLKQLKNYCLQNKSMAFVCIAAVLHFATAFAPQNASAANRESWFYSETENSENQRIDFYDDFDGYLADDISALYAKWKINCSADGSSAVKITGNDDKHLRLETTATDGYTGAYIDTYPTEVGRSVLISFDILAQSGGGINVGLNYGAAELINTDKYGTVTYLGGGAKSKLRGEGGISVAFLWDTSQNSITAFENGAKKCIIEGFAPKGDSLCLRFYFGAGSNAYAEFDNIRIINTAQRNDGLYFRHFLTEPKENIMKIDYIIVNTGAEEKAMSIYAAAFNENILSKIKSADFLAEADSAEIKTEYLHCEDNAEIRIFTLDGKTLAPYTKAAAQDETRYMFQNKRSDIYAMLHKNNTLGVHPRLIATAADFKNMRESAQSAPQRSAVLEKADAMLKNADDIYYPTAGNFLSMARHIKGKLLYMAASYNITNEVKYLDEARAVMKKVCEFKDWNIELPISNGEICSGMAICYDWLYNSLPETERTAVKNAIWEKALKNAYEAYTLNGGKWWMKEYVNRNIVTNGSYIQGALALADEEQYRAQCETIINTGVYCIAYMLTSFLPDGAWEEGGMYLGYTLEYLAKTYASIESALGTNFNLDKCPGLPQTVKFIFYLSGVGGRNNFHDDSATDILNSQYTLYLIRMFGSEEDSAYYESLRQLKKADLQLFDLIWQAEPAANPSFLPDGYFRGVEFVSMRDTWDNKNAKTFLSFHGGKNNGGHSHTDAGTFVLDIGGERWAEDLGADNIIYTNPSVDKTTVYRIRTEGHNCLVINPNDDASAETMGGGQSAETDAKVISFETTPTGAAASLDLSSAYPASCTSVVRTYTLENNRTAAVITDYINLKQNSEIYWFMHTKKTDRFEKTADNSVLLERGGKKLRVTFELSAEEKNVAADIYIAPAQKSATSPPLSVDAAEADNSAYEKLVIKIKNAPAGANVLKVSLKGEA